MSTATDGHIVIDWATSWPDGADGVWIVNDITLDQYNALVEAQPDKRSGMIINALKVSGYKVKWIPKPNRITKIVDK